MKLFKCSNTRVTFMVEETFFITKVMERSPLYVIVLDNDNRQEWWIHPKINGKKNIPAYATEIRCTWDDVLKRYNRKQAFFHQDCFRLGVVTKLDTAYAVGR